MEVKYKIGDKVYYKKCIGVAPTEYVIRRGVVKFIKVSCGALPSYQVDSLDSGVSFLLTKHELYESQKEILQTIQC